MLLSEVCDPVTPAIPGVLLLRLGDRLEVKPGVLINGIRTMVTGQAVGPGLFDVLMAIGRNRIVTRLRKTPTLFEENSD